MIIIDSSHSRWEGFGVKAEIRRHYHWVIAIVMLQEMFVYVGILNNINGLYLVPVTEALHISRGNFSLAFSVRSLIGACSVILSGPVIRRLGYRRLTAAGLLLASAAFVLLALCRNTYMLYLSTAMIGIADGFCMTTGAVYLIGNWFHRHHGAMLGLVTAATGIGGSAYCILITAVMEQADWRISLVICAATTVITAILIAVLIRNDPKDMKLSPLGEGELAAKKRRQKMERDHWQGFSMVQLVKMPVFYLTLLGVFLCNVCLYSAYYNVVPYLQDCGVGTAQAAAMQSIMLLVMAGFKLLCGVFSDWFGAKWVTAICLVALTVSLTLFSLISGLTDAWAAVLVFSLALPMMSVTIPLLTASLFGYNAHNSFSGIFLALPPVAAVIASPLANIVYDRVGTYRPVFTIAAIASVFIFLLHMIVFLLADRARKTADESTPIE